MPSARTIRRSTNDESSPRAAAKVKVLQVLEATSFGTACYMANLLLNIDLNAFDVSLAYSPLRSDERFRSDLKKIGRRGIRIHEIPMQRNIRPMEDTRSMWKLYRLIRAEKFDIVHGHSSKGGFLARAAAKLADYSIATVYSPHAISISLNRAYLYVERLAGLLTSMVLGVSVSERDELASYRLVAPSKLRYVTTGIDVAAFSGSFGGGQLRQRLGVPDGAMLIGTAGRVTEQKDPTTFLEAAAQALKKGLKAHFAWAGDGDLKRESQELAIRLGIDKDVTFLGYCADLRPFLEALDIFALTSRFESFGYVTCEAMAMCKPVVATNVSGSKELVVPGVTGYLVDVGDRDGFAKSFCELAGNADLRHRMGKGGGARAREHYDLPRTIRGLEQIYRELLSAPQASRVSRESAGVAPLEVNN